MQYDPIKRTLGNVFNKSVGLRKLFYRLLDMLLLRAWHMHRALARALRDAATDRPSILDAGAGFGQYTYWMWRRYPEGQILAVDVKEEQVADCNRFFGQLNAKNVRFEVADLTAFERPESFDLALSVDVMEHIEDDTGVFRNICRSLKPGGILLISTPSDQGGSDADDESDSSFIGEHVRNGYNLQEITDKLRQAGFSKVDARYTYGVPGNISWRLSMKYPILMLGASKLFFILLPFYYLVAYPVACILNWMDVSMTHSKGTGLLVRAWK
jgi:SAM-dependent methyltransferase